LHIDKGKPFGARLLKDLIVSAKKTTLKNQRAGTGQVALNSLAIFFTAFSESVFLRKISAIPHFSIQEIPTNNSIRIHIFFYF